MFKELWQRIKTKQRTGAKLTRKEQILAELDRDIGTAKQLADRSGVKSDDCPHDIVSAALGDMGSKTRQRCREREHLGSC